MINSSIRSRSAAVAVPAQATTQASSDEMLVARIADGDRLAMQTLFARHRTYVYRWLLRFVGNETQAEDLLSDVFLDVWRQAGRFEGRSAVATWLLSIARFKALSARRRRTDAELDEGIESTFVDPADDPETVLQNKDGRHALHAPKLPSQFQAPPAPLRRGFAFGKLMRYPMWGVSAIIVRLGSAKEAELRQVRGFIAFNDPIGNSRSGSRPKPKRVNSTQSGTEPRHVAFIFSGRRCSERPTMPTPKLYRRQAEDCVELANEATELYAKTALLELAAEFRESAERLEHRMQEPKGQFCI